MKVESDNDSTAKVSELRDEIARLRGDLLTLARRVSHDLRTPLGGIISAGEALKETLTDEASLITVTSALNSLDDLGRLIKRVSFVVQASALPQPPQRMDMGEAVTSALMRLGLKISSSDATLSKPASWPEMMGVSDWLEVVWSNLLANALRYAGTTPQIELGWREEQGRFRFWVADHGPGIPADKLKGLFTPFHRLHELSAPRGLGLPIVQRLVELQGGACGYEPNGNRGACFFFVLPGDNP